MSSKLLGKYYTIPKIAKLCLNKINNIDDYDLVLEPSAGSGSFSNLIKNKSLISIDIEPENENVTKMDFLKEKLELDSYKNIIAIGNPPFGKQNNLAIKFFNKCASYSHVNCIAMIFPKSFKKVSIHDRCILNYLSHIIYLKIPFCLKIKFIMFLVSFKIGNGVKIHEKNLKYLNLHLKMYLFKKNHNQI